MERERIIEWMKERGITNRQLAELLKITEDKVSKSLSPVGKPRRWQGDEVLKLMELMSPKPPTVYSEVRSAEMSPEQVRQAWSVRDAPMVCVLGTAFGSEWIEDIDVETTELHLDEVIQRIDRPPSLLADDEAYALEIVGDSMSPRFEPGELVFVSPKSQVRLGDDVIVQIRGTGEEQLADRVVMVLIKRLLRRSSSYIELRQFNPDKTFRVPAERVLRIHRVKGRL